MKLESPELLEKALTHYSTEIKEAHIPKVLSSIMSTGGLPMEFAGIGDYILAVRTNLEEEAGGELNQMQTICLDSVCEILILLKFIGTFIGQDISGSVIAYDKTGTPRITDLAIKGFGGLHQILDKKIKLFHELALKHKKADEDDAYIKAVMGGGKPVKGR